MIFMLTFVQRYVIRTNIVEIDLKNEYNSVLFLFFFFLLAGL